MTFESIIDLIKKIADISLVWVMFYYILKNIRNNVKLTLLFKGVAVILILKIVSDFIGLQTIGLLLEYVIMWGPLALIIIFQPEIRTALEQLGRTQLLGRHKVLTVDERERLVYEIIQAMDYLRKSRIGALIVIERDMSLGNYIDKGKKIYADLSSDLLIAIFFPNNPLHDGGVIIQGDRITCAGAVFPTSSNSKTNKRLGTRHRAALGIVEETDAISLVVSEETGRLSVAVKGELFYNLSLDDVRMMLIDELRPKQETEEEILEEEEIYEEDK
ncbi:MAG: diadenylate cyclase CdaA [Bacilli bacterium]